MLDASDTLLSYSFGEFVALMGSAQYISPEGALLAVEGGLMEFATFERKPAGLNQKALAKAGLAAANTLVPGTKTKKVWVVHRSDQASPTVDVDHAAMMCSAWVGARNSGPFQSHMHRYRLELAQCGGRAGHALLRTFVDSFLFDLHAAEAGALQGGVLCDPRSR